MWKRAKERGLSLKMLLSKAKEKGIYLTNLAFCEWKVYLRAKYTKLDNLRLTRWLAEYIILRLIVNHSPGLVPLSFIIFNSKLNFKLKNNYVKVDYYKNKIKNFLRPRQFFNDDKGLCDFFQTKIAVRSLGANQSHFWDRFFYLGGGRVKNPFFQREGKAHFVANKHLFFIFSLLSNFG